MNNLTRPRSGSSYNFSPLIKGRFLNVEDQTTQIKNIIFPIIAKTSKEFKQEELPNSIKTMTLIKKLKENFNKEHDKWVKKAIDESKFEIREKISEEFKLFMNENHLDINQFPNKMTFHNQWRLKKEKKHFFKSLKKEFVERDIPKKIIVQYSKYFPLLSSRGKDMSVKIFLKNEIKYHLEPFKQKYLKDYFDSKVDKVLLFLDQFHSLKYPKGCKNKKSKYFQLRQSIFNLKSLPIDKNNILFINIIRLLIKLAQRKSLTIQFDKKDEMESKKVTFFKNDMDNIFTRIEKCNILTNEMIKELKSVFL